MNISIHALRKESDLGSAHISVFPSIFQSTLSVRRATGWKPSAAKHGRFQSTLSVRRATQRRVISVITVDISIHALRKESDFRRI